MTRAVMRNPRRRSHLASWAVAVLAAATIGLSAPPARAAAQPTPQPSTQPALQPAAEPTTPPASAGSPDTTATDPDPTADPAAGPSPAAAVTPLAEPGGPPPGAAALPAVDAEAFLLADATTGQVLASRNLDQPRAMASTTKAMTAMLALERLDLDQTVTIGPAPGKVGGSALELQAGERLTVRQLLTGLLVHSANDAAVALAEAADGSVGAFVHRMNVRARELGLTRTRYTNPHGLDQRGHHTSVQDLARLWLTALADPTFAELVATRTTRLPGPPDVRQFTNTNELLGTYRWVDGGKTGFTDAAGRCLVVSAERGGRELVAVALGSTDAFVDAKALLEHGFAGFVRARVAAEGATVDLPGQGAVRTLENVDALVRRDLLGQTALTLPAEPGDRDSNSDGQVGSLVAGGTVIGPVGVAPAASGVAGGATDRGVAGAGEAPEEPVGLDAVPVPPDADPTIINPFLGVQSQGRAEADVDD